MPFNSFPEILEKAKMDDITFCKGEKCPLKDSCYRSLRKPSSGVFYIFSKSPWDGKDCNHYMEVTNDTKRKNAAPSKKSKDRGFVSKGTTLPKKDLTDKEDGESF